MIKFVIVDDESKDIDYIKELLNKIVKEDKKIISFTKFGEDLKEEIENVEERKIYILDIQLGNKVSGINIAKMIRDIDYESEIIFITNHDSMFESAHRGVYNVFKFIEKFHNFEKDFKKAIKDIIKQNFDNKMFKYGASNIDINIYYKNILYICRDKEDRKLVMVTDHNKFMINMTIKDILTMLDDRFRQCHRSCIVNKTRIQEKNYKEGYFLLDNGERVDLLSKKYKKELDND